jgi:2-methylfumaryl-CoA hydratase
MTAHVAPKAFAGNFFEDFQVGAHLAHATPRTLTEGDRALYIGLTGARHLLHCNAAAARGVGYADAPLDDVLVFHTVFGKSVPDISLNAVANLGYAECRFHRPVFAGDTLEADSKVIGLKQNSNGATGTVWVRTAGRNQRGETVVDWVRWVMVNKRDREAPEPEAVVPALQAVVPAGDLIAPAGTDFRAWSDAQSGSAARWEDYAVGERIDHVDGMTIEEAEHATATRLYQNTAKVHFNQHLAATTRFNRRLIYGGHVISLARALSFNGLANACLIAAINAGRHVAPCFAGDTVFAWSEVKDKAALDGRGDLGALRLRTIATKNEPCVDFPAEPAPGKFDPSVILDLDYWVRAAARLNPPCRFAI